MSNFPGDEISSNSVAPKSTLLDALALYPVLHNIARRADETPGCLHKEDPKSPLYQRGFLKPQDQMGLASTCKILFNRFEEGRRARIVSKLLQCVAHGQQSQAEQLLKEIPVRNSHLGCSAKPEWLLVRGDVIDPSGRMFKNITAFEYALWALDSHMYTMMLNCVPQNAHGRRIKIELLRQYQSVITKGVNYTVGSCLLNMSHDPSTLSSSEQERLLKSNLEFISYENTVFMLTDNESGLKTFSQVPEESSKVLASIIGKLKVGHFHVTYDKEDLKIIASETGRSYQITGATHFNLNPLKIALDTYVQNINTWTELQCINHWCLVVGKAQYRLPAHVVREWCHPWRARKPQIPTYKEKFLPESQIFHNFLTNRNESWWPASDAPIKLGVDFAVSLGILHETVCHFEHSLYRFEPRNEIAGGHSHVHKQWAKTDLEAVTAFMNQRENELREFAAKLNFDPEKKCQEMEQNRCVIC